MTKKFYDRIGQKYDKYDYIPNATYNFPSERPEDIFKQKLINLVTSESSVLDVGCADGIFTLAIAPYVSKIVGIDYSAEMIRLAKQQSRGAKVPVTFISADIRKYSPDALFDVVYSRRGPQILDLLNSLLKKNGYYAEIALGEKDSLDLKNTFRRGQGYVEWDYNFLSSKKKKLTEQGFHVLYSSEFEYEILFPDIRSFSEYLKHVPIIPDYNEITDKNLLDAYVKHFERFAGIPIKPHRTVIIAQNAK